jgi:hypothetical protein
MSSLIRRSSAPPPPTLAWATVPTTGCTRVLRVTAFGAASLLLAGLAHILGGGRLPDLGLGLLLTAATGMVAVVLTARRCRLPLLLTVLGAEQLILHALFTDADPVPCATSAIPALHGGATCLPPAEAAVAAASHPLPLLMLAAHLLATVATAWLLARGEAALWRLADRVVRAATAAVTPSPSSAPAVLSVSPLRTLTARVLRDDAAPRGPPTPWPATH